MNIRIGALAVVAVLSTPCVAAGQEVTYSGALQYSTGEYYFTERTNSVYLTNGLAIDTGRLGFSARLPAIWQSSPWVSHGSGGGVPTGGTQEGQVRDGLGQRGGDRDGRGPGAGAVQADAGSARRSTGARDGRIALEDTTSYDEIGVGDPTFRAEADLTSPGLGPWSVALGGEVKPPLADPDRGFGTGAWDAAIDLSVARRLSSTFLFADLGYLVLGDMEELELKDPVTFAGGVGHSLPGGRVGLLATLSGSTRILEETDPPLELGAGLSFRLAPGRSLSTNVAFGLTESSPDVSLAVGWTVGL